MDGKKRGHPSTDYDDSSSSGDDSSVQRHVSGSNLAPDNQAEESYYSSHITSVCAAMNIEAEKRMSPFEQLMLDKRRETNRMSARKCRKRRREEIKTLEEELRHLESETEELTAEKAKLEMEFQQEVANSKPAAVNPPAMTVQTPALQAVQALYGNQLSHMMSSQQQQQFHQMMQLRHSTTSSFMPLNPMSATFSPPLAAGYDMASLPSLSNVQRLAQSHGLDLSRTAHSRAALSALPPANDMLSLLPLLQANQLQNSPFLQHHSTPSNIRGDLLGSAGGHQYFAPMSPFVATAAPTTDANRTAMALLDRRQQEGELPQQQQQQQQSADTTWLQDIDRLLSRQEPKPDVEDGKMP